MLSPADEKLFKICDCQKTVEIFPPSETARKNSIHTMGKTQILLLSTSTLHGSEFLKYAEHEISTFLNKNNVKQVLFVPYALQNHDQYTEKVRDALIKLGYEVEGIHKAPDAVQAVNSAQAIYIGGGNTFQLLKSLYDLSLIEVIRKRVLQGGIPYIGSSAGSNVATTSICTTNDMPIVYPPSFKALGLVPFNINPHFIDADPHSKHMGETREERIKQYHELPGMPPVLGLREGCMLLIDGGKATLKGQNGAKLFSPFNEPVEYDAEADVSFLLTPIDSVS